ncbi:MAG: sigma 54-interacting transcriptional regulator [Trichlorobacter sp.]|jgi:hypothetical protein
MTKPLTLTSRDRDFFHTVSLAAVANPFSPERKALDRAIAANDSTPSDDKALIDVVTDRVAGRLETLRKEQRNDPLRYQGKDRRLLQTAFQFEIYHRFRAPFDAFILSQQKAGDRPIKLPFVREVLAELGRLGYSNQDSLRYLEIFYQIRRAFYFIDTALVGVAPCMHTLRLQIWNNIFTRDINLYDQHLWNKMEDFSTLLLGETGTGKGAAAAAIGCSGFIPFDEKNSCFTESFTRSFLSRNLSQYPESLLESELFGHRKGAFTGAIDNHEGVFSHCSSHGSIFLDEIGDISLPVQIKLLQVLQERTFCPVGSHERLRFNGRVIAATNRPLDELRQTGQFRNDFYYRLCSDLISVPPLRQRIQEEPQELPALVVSILNRLLGDAGSAFSGRICETLLADLGTGYTWPGNVRELEQAVRRILLTNRYTGDRSGQRAGLQDLLMDGINQGNLDAQTLLAHYCTMLYQRFGTYEEVARRTGLDRRTARKYIHIQEGE